MTGVFLSNRGIALPVPETHPVYKYMVLAFIVGCILTYILRRWARRRQDETGKPFPIVVLPVNIARLP